MTDITLFHSDFSTHNKGRMWTETLVLSATVLGCVGKPLMELKSSNDAGEGCTMNYSDNFVLNSGKTYHVDFEVAFVSGMNGTMQCYFGGIGFRIYDGSFSFILDNTDIAVLPNATNYWGFASKMPDFDFTSLNKYRLEINPTCGVVRYLILDGSGTFVEVHKVSQVNSGLDGVISYSEAPTFKFKAWNDSPGGGAGTGAILNVSSVCITELKTSHDPTRVWTGRRRASNYNFTTLSNRNIILGLKVNANFGETGKNFKSTLLTYLSLETDGAVQFFLYKNNATGNGLSYTDLGNDTMVQWNSTVTPFSQASGELPIYTHRFASAGKHYIDLTSFQFRLQAGETLILVEDSAVTPSGVFSFGYTEEF